MRFPQVDTILTLLKKCCKPLPLFLGAISIILLVSASVPGQQQGGILNLILMPIILILGIPNLLGIPSELVIILFLISIIISATYYLHRRWRKRDRLQISEILSLSIAIITSLLLSYDIPAQLRFYTSATEFDRVTQQVLDGIDYQNVKKIGSFNIIGIRLDRNSVENPPVTSIYFNTGNFSVWMDRTEYGFAYILNRHPTSNNQMRYTHIYGKWYIFEFIAD